MANIFTNYFENRRAKRQVTEANALVDEIDSIVRQTINSSLGGKLPGTISVDNTPALTRPGQAIGKSITGKLKKKFAPNREITKDGIHINHFNMSDIYSAYVGENLVKFSADKYAEATTRNGWYIDSKNPTVTKYINKRLKEFEVVSNSPTNEVINDFMIATILYGNAPLVKHRQTNASSGKVYSRWDNKRISPIASLYVEDFRKLILGEGPGGKMRYLRTNQNVDQMNLNLINPSLFNLPKSSISGMAPALYNPVFNAVFSRFTNLFRLTPRRKKDYVVYDEEDLVHIRYHHVPGEKIAMPPFWPTLNDIDSLRRIEENIELLVYQYGHPILHAQVGDDKQAGDKEEIEDIYRKLQDIENNGFIVTSNRAMIDMIGAESQALRLDAYLLYFYRRVLTGLWLSEVTVGIGDTSNRSTANTLDKLSQEKVVELQKIFADTMQPIMIELLLEAGVSMSWAIQPENIPSFVFNPVDVEGLIKKEQHVLTKWEAGMLSEDEMRRETGKEPFTDQERKSTYTYLHAIPLKEAGPAAVGGGGQSGKVTQQGLRPKNQHGQKSGPSQSQNS